MESFHKIWEYCGNSRPLFCGIPQYFLFRRIFCGSGFVKFRKKTSIPYLLLLSDKSCIMETSTGSYSPPIRGNIKWYSLYPSSLTGPSWIPPHQGIGEVPSSSIDQFTSMRNLIFLSSQPHQPHK